MELAEYTLESLHEDQDFVLHPGRAPKTDRKAVFSPPDPFSQKAAGMGLSICQTIVEAHGGRLCAIPNDGPGATFQFTLPVEVTAQEAA